jgi:hypothetical protein
VTCVSASIRIADATFPATVVMVAEVPVRLSPSVAVTVVAVPATVCAARTTDARPLASVVDVAVAKLPFAPLFVHVTVFPLVPTAFPFASASCAVIVTVTPAAGAVVEAVTR